MVILIRQRLQYADYASPRYLIIHANLLFSKYGHLRIQTMQPLSPKQDFISNTSCLEFG